MWEVVSAKVLSKEPARLKTSRKKHLLSAIWLWSLWQALYGTPLSGDSKIAAALPYYITAPLA